MFTECSADKKHYVHRLLHRSPTNQDLLYYVHFKVLETGSEKLRHLPKVTYDRVAGLGFEPSFPDTIQPVLFH